ncbi:hypothetical protein AVEN_244993-1, partial [Araneus ventricosus]
MPPSWIFVHYKEPEREKTLLMALSNNLVSALSSMTNEAILSEDYLLVS